MIILMAVNLINFEELEERLEKSARNNINFHFATYQLHFYHILTTVKIYTFRI